VPEDIVIDVKNPYAAEILRDLADAKQSTSGRRVLLLKYMLENLMTLEREPSGLSMTAIAHLRQAVLNELT
jgi:hypothetical protein